MKKERREKDEAMKRRKIEKGWKVFLGQFAFAF